MKIRGIKNIVMAMTVALTIGCTGVVSFATGGSTADTYKGAESNQTSEGALQINVPQGDQNQLKEIAEKVQKGQEPLQAKNAGDSLSSSLFKISEDGSTVTFDTKSFKLATEKSNKQNMDTFSKALTNSQVSPETQQYIFDLITNSDPDASVILIPILMDSTKADIYTAMRIVEPFLGFMRVVFGLGAIVIVLLLTTSTIIDLCYVGLPMARGGDGDKPSLPFVSADAVSVVKESESGTGSDGKYKNAYITYFKRRALTYIVLAICLLYLVAGELGGVISWFLNLASGLV